MFEAGCLRRSLALIRKCARTACCAAAPAPGAVDGVGGVSSFVRAKDFPQVHTHSRLSGLEFPHLARISDYVKVIDCLSGARNYEVRLEVGKIDGKRKQKQLRFAKLQDAINAYNSERGDRSRGVQVSPSDVTLRRAADEYLDSPATPSPRTLRCSGRRSRVSGPAGVGDSS